MSQVAKAASGPVRVANAKIGLIQFCLSPPKTNIENNIQVKDYQAMDRLLREERSIIAKMVKTIRDTGCNVLLIQKSILRDATTVGRGDTGGVVLSSKLKLMKVKLSKGIGTII